MVDDGAVGYVVLEACFRHWLTNRSSKTTANCVLTSNHSRGRRFHSSAQYRRRPRGVVRPSRPRGGSGHRAAAAARACGARSRRAAVLPCDRQPTHSRCRHGARVRRARGRVVRRLSQRSLGSGQPDANPPPRHHGHAAGTRLRGGTSNS
jgi:hypothetical protein